MDTPKERARICSDMTFTRPTTDDEVYHQFLRSEIRNYTPDDQEVLLPVLNAPDFKDVEQNFLRRTALYSRRWKLLSQLPDPLEWRFGHLESPEISDLYVPKNCGWDSFCPGNRLTSIRYPEGCSEETRRKIRQISNEVLKPDFDRTLILIGQDEDGPFTILDGNHRAAAIMSTTRDGRKLSAAIPSYLGLSPRMNLCIWFVQS